MHIPLMTRRTGANDSGDGGWATLDINNLGYLSLTVDDDFYGNECQNTNYTANSVFDGTWHHIVGVKSNTLYSLFLDGQAIATISDSHVLSASDGTRDFWIGRHVWNNVSLGSSDLDASLRDVRIYNRALSSNEVQQLYAYESGPSIALLKAVKPSFSNLKLGVKYQLQVSLDLNTWYDQGLPFSATSTDMVYSQYWDVANWNQLFFRLQSAP
jgi:hypothetical protein